MGQKTYLIHFLIINFPCGHAPRHSKKIQKLTTFLPMGIFSNPIQGLGKIKRRIRICGQFDKKKVSLDQNF